MGLSQNANSEKTAQQIETKKWLDYREKGNPAKLILYAFFRKIRFETAPFLFYLFHCYSKADSSRACLICFDISAMLLRDRLRKG